MSAQSKSQSSVTVSIDDDFLAGIDAVTDPGERWNGWACPWFARDAVERIIAEHNAHAQSLGADATVLNWVGDTVVETWADSADSADAALDVWTPTVQDGVTRWAIGAHAWTWSIDLTD